MGVVTRVAAMVAARVSMWAQVVLAVQEETVEWVAATMVASRVAMLVREAVPEVP